MCLPPPTSISPAAPIFPPPQLQQDHIPFPSIKTPNWLSPANGHRKPHSSFEHSSRSSCFYFAGPACCCAFSDFSDNSSESFSSGSCLPASSPLQIPSCRVLLLYITALDGSVPWVLSSPSAKGKENALYYLSRTLVEAEWKYTPIDKTKMSSSHVRLTKA